MKAVRSLLFFVIVHFQRYSFHFLSLLNVKLHGDLSFLFKLTFNFHNETFHNGLNVKLSCAVETCHAFSMVLARIRILLFRPIRILTRKYGQAIGFMQVVFSRRLESATYANQSLGFFASFYDIDNTSFLLKRTQFAQEPKLIE